MVQAPQRMDSLKACICMCLLFCHIFFRKFFFCAMKTRVFQMSFKSKVLVEFFLVFFGGIFSWEFCKKMANRQNLHLGLGVNHPFHPQGWALNSASSPIDVPSCLVINQWAQIWQKHGIFWTKGNLSPTPWIFQNGIVSKKKSNFPLLSADPNLNNA